MIKDSGSVGTEIMEVGSPVDTFTDVPSPTSSTTALIAPTPNGLDIVKAIRENQVTVVSPPINGLNGMNGINGINGVNGVNGVKTTPLNGTCVSPMSPAGKVEILKVINRAVESMAQSTGVVDMAAKARLLRNKEKKKKRRKRKRLGSRYDTFLRT